MKGITSWTRIEPVPRTDDLAPGLRAALADPLWLLGRQWQFGELSGEDAGSPIEAALTVEAAPLDRFLAGPVTTGADRRAIDLDPAVPLEVLAERRPAQGTASDGRIRIDAGQHFLRLLTLHGAASQRQRFVAEFPIDPATLSQRATGTAIADPAPAMAIVAARVPDGRAVATRLLDHRGAAAELTSLPARPAVASTFQAKVLAAANEFLAWWETFVSEPARAAGDAWDPSRLEYSFAVQATLSDGAVVLSADGYRGGHLDWSAFDTSTPTATAALGSAGGRAPTTLVRRTIPTRAFYAGMPAERFWEFEDSSVRFSGGSVARTDLAHLLLDEFALSYGNDWFVIPVRLAAGSLCAVRELTVVDTFGQTTVVAAASTIGSSSWSMYHVTPRPGAPQRVHRLMVLPTTLGNSQQGEPIEEVNWFRDEMANVVWAVEHRVESALGGGIERGRAGDPIPAAAGEPVAIDTGDAELIYRLNTTVPDHWYPLVPARPVNAPAGVVQLQLRPITQVDAGGNAVTHHPVGRFLTAASPLVIEEEEVPRDGLVTTAQWQLTRGRDGRYHLWLSHQARVGRGEGSSGLAFDVSRPV
jgi:hypothetical protein